MSECSGCISYGTVCAGEQSSKNIKCPCMVCIIKVICKNACEEYEAFREYIDRYNLMKH